MRSSDICAAGLGIATIAACAGFAAISGSSVATAATFATVAYPEMRRYNYPQSFATGVIAAGGTLGAMLPPSTVLAVYGIITEQDIGKLFIAGIIPGIACRIDGHAHHRDHRPAAAEFPAAAPRHSWPERLERAARHLGDACCCSSLSSAAFMAACSRRPKPAAWARSARF